MNRGWPDLTWPLEPLEIAAGTTLEPELPLPPPGRRGPGPRQALEEIVRDQLLAGPVSVSFSGGRDSSLILAVACHVARREGLPDPVPVTMRHDSEDSEESEWQQRVIDHLGLRRWRIVTLTDEMDLLGDLATSFLEQAGVLAPPNAYLHLPMAMAAGSGSLLTGVCGDEVLGGRGKHLARVLGGQARPRPRDALSVGLAASPGSARRWWEARKGVAWAPWLTPEAVELVAKRVATSEARFRLRWDVEAVTFARSRFVQLERRALGAVGDRYGVRVVSPLGEPTFVDAFARAVGVGGPRGRTWSMQLLGGDLLPAAVLSRPTKAVFDAMVWGARLRAFAEGWDGTGLGEEYEGLVVVDRLRDEWLRPRPAYGSSPLAQRAWLGTLAPSSAVS